MIDKFFAVGITLEFDRDERWWASVNFEDYGHAVDNSVHGRLSTKYGQTIESAIDCITFDLSNLVVFSCHIVISRICCMKMLKI